MSRITVITLFAAVAQICGNVKLTNFVDNLVNKLLDQSLKVWPVDRVNLDDTRLQATRSKSRKRSRTPSKDNKKGK